MSNEIGRKAIDMFVYLAEGGKSIEITFTGGEPLIEFPVLAYLTDYAQQRVREAGMQAHFVLKTNGTILNQDIIDFMRLHCIRIVVSIDGSSVVHDRHRRTAGNKRTHDIVCRNLLALLHNQIPCVASVTVHPDSSLMVLESIRYLHGLGVEQIDIGPAYGTVTWSNLDNLNLSQSLMDVAGYVREVNNKGYRIDVGPLYRESEHVGGILSDQWGCHAASTNLAFLPNGQVTGCSALGMLISRFPELVLGDVFDGLDQLAIDHLLQLAQTRGEDRPACQGCKVAANCTGGCLAINYSTSGFALIPPDVYCQTIATIPKAWRTAWADNDSCMVKDETSERCTYWEKMLGSGFAITFHRFDSGGRIDQLWNNLVISSLNA
jgi:uncharacterized protein